MPAVIYNINETNTLVLLHSCDDCGADASFGINVSYRKALNALVKDKPDLARKLLGQWYCVICWRKRK